MARRTYGPAGNERKAIMSGGVAVCVLTLVLTVTASVMVVKYLNSSADLAYASTLAQYRDGAGQPARAPEGGGPGGGEQGEATATPEPARDPRQEASDPGQEPTGTPAATEPAQPAESPEPTGRPSEQPTGRPTESPGAAETDPPQASNPVEPTEPVESTEPSGTEEPPDGTDPPRTDKLGRRDGPVVRKRQDDPAVDTTQTPEPPDTDATDPGGDGEVDGTPSGVPDGTAADGSAGGDGDVGQDSPATGEGSIITYVVEPGDTLGGIARQFGVAVDAIATENGIADPNVIYAGQVLSIPGGKPGQGQVSPNTGPED